MAKKKAAPAAQDTTGVVRSISTQMAKTLKIGESFRISGRITMKENINTQYGVQTRFRGEFGAVIDGKKFFSRRAYLPETISDELESAVDNRTDKKPVEFVVELTKEKSTEVKAGFVWEVTPIVAPQTSPDRVFELLDNAG